MVHLLARVRFQHSSERVQLIRLEFDSVQKLRHGLDELICILNYRLDARVLVFRPHNAEIQRLDQTLHSLMDRD